VRWTAVGLLLLLTGGNAWAQAPEPVGPYVLDARVTTATLPTDPAFYPPLANDTFIPGRSWGGEVGGAVYPWQVGPARLGLGASLLRTRGTAALKGADAIVANLTALVPQVSLNFGTGMGWSYLSGGVGSGTVSTRVTDAKGQIGRAATGRRLALNVGGGARWFSNRHVALGFDARFHRLAAGTSVVTLAGTTAGATTGTAATGASSTAASSTASTGSSIPTPGASVLVISVGLSLR